MSTSTTPGAGGSEDSQGVASPGPSFSKPTESSKGKNTQAPKKPKRDDRDFESTDSLRGIIQALENNSRQMESRLTATLTALIDQKADAARLDLGEQIQGLSVLLEEHENKLDAVDRLVRSRPVAEEPSPTPSQTRSPTANVATPVPGSVPNPRPAIPRVFEPRVPEEPSVAPDLPHQHHQHQQPYSSYLRPSPEASPAPSFYQRHTKLTESFDYLSDGLNPTFRQWQISISDRFQINYDHYDSDLTKKALVWSTTKGAARSYLEPRYQAKKNPYQTAEEMLKTLEEYFTTGHEDEDFRSEFHDIEMCQGEGNTKETFAQFAARFKNLAILGNISENDWCYQMWNRITPQLAHDAAPNKHLWNEDFRAMVINLTSLDLDRRRTNRRNHHPTSRNAPSGGNKTTATNPVAPYKAAQKQFRPATASAPYSAFKKTETKAVKFSTSPIRPPTKPIAKDACYLCGKPGHFRKDCPDLPAIRALINEIDSPDGNDTADQEVDEDESEDIREGNEEA